ncbi:MAG: methyltransferase [Pyrinomonadaceae bacterium]|nr:methyltransferase [Pyrinomonadaceae bacterium]
MSKNVKPSPESLLEIAVGYQRSGVLFALVELEIPTFLRDEPRSIDEIAAQTDVDKIALDRLLNAAVALGLIEREDDSMFQNSSSSNEFLVKDEADYLGEQFLFYKENSYPRWTELTEKLRDWQAGNNDEQDADDEDQDAETLAPQHNLALLAGKALGRAFDFTKSKKMLDVGGGTGAMSIAICEGNEDLQATVFDLANVAKVADEFIKKAGLENRITTKIGNFKSDDLPTDFDVILLANLLSVASEDTNRKFLKQIYDKLPDDGVCLISGWILDDSRASPETAVLFCLEDVMNGVPDVERTETTYRKWLEDAGFTDVKREIYLAPYSFIAATK